MVNPAESKIWVLVEHRDGRPLEVGLEILGKVLNMPRPKGWKVAAVLAGGRLGALPEKIMEYGVDEVLCAEHSLLDGHCNQTKIKALEGHIRAHRPEVLLLGATAEGTDLGARLAARLRTGLCAHCVDLELAPDGRLLAVVPGWGGSLMARIECPEARPQMATIAPGTFPMPKPAESRRGKIIRLEVGLEPGDVTYKVIRIEGKATSPTGLDTAETVVAGGWGIGDKTGWRLIEELADLLNGAVGATRPAMDEGWADESQMIGTSGRSVRPRLYIGVALSGHAHHMVGVKGPELAVGINKDPDAPVFDHCDIGLVGDYREIVPALIREIKDRMGR